MFSFPRGVSICGGIPMFGGVRSAAKFGTPEPVPIPNLRVPHGPQGPRFYSAMNDIILWDLSSRWAPIGSIIQQVPWGPPHNIAGVPPRIVDPPYVRYYCTESGLWSDPGYKDAQLHVNTFVIYPRTGPIPLLSPKIMLSYKTSAP